MCPNTSSKSGRALCASDLIEEDVNHKGLGRSWLKGNDNMIDWLRSEKQEMASLVAIQPVSLRQLLKSRRNHHINARIECNVIMNASDFLIGLATTSQQSGIFLNRFMQIYMVNMGRRVYVRLDLFLPSKTW